VVGGLAVDNVFRARCQLLRRARAVTAPLFPDDEEQADSRHPVPAHSLDGRNLSGDDAFGVARPTSEETVTFETTGEERRDAIDVRRQHDIDLPEGCVEVAAVALDRLLDDGKSRVFQESQ